MIGAVVLTLITAVGVQVEEAGGLDAAEKHALITELDRAVEHVIGAPTSAAAQVSLVLRARRIGWRIRVGLERRDSGRATGSRIDLDLTRDRASWQAPLRDAARTLLPEGRALLPAASAKSGPKDPPPVARSEARSETPAPPQRDPPPAITWQPPADPPKAQRAAGPLVTAELVQEEPGPRVLPWIVLGASVVVGIIGTSFAIQASNALDGIAAPGHLPDPAELERRERELFQGALLGSILLSAATSGIVSSTVLLLD